jgi:hypothetical protein
MKTDKETKKIWDKAANKLTGVHCGRLDMSSYNAETTEMERFIYTDQTAKGQRTRVSGPFCDELAYMAAMYPVLIERINQLEKGE